MSSLDKFFKSSILFLLVVIILIIIYCCVNRNSNAPRPIVTHKTCNVIYLYDGEPIVDCTDIRTPLHSSTPQWIPPLRRKNPPYYQIDPKTISVSEPKPIYIVFGAIAIWFLLKIRRS
jgi:hypothetical protein